jgi:acetyltransferase-like isoleucine patch superfamily enzyme
MKIGNRVAIYSSTFDALYPELITIGDDVTITLATILVHDDAPVLFCGKRLVSPVTIGNRVFIGARSVILAGVNIGNDCILAAGSVATKNIPSGGVYAGNPARFIRSIEDYRLKITNDPNLLPVQLKSNLTDGDEETAMREAVASRWGK